MFNGVLLMPQRNPSKEMGQIPQKTTGLQVYFLSNYPSSTSKYHDLANKLGYNQFSMHVHACVKCRCVWYGCTKLSIMCIAYS